MFVVFSQADHDTTFRRDIWREYFCADKEFEALLVVCLRADVVVEVWCGFQIVIEYVGLGVENGLQCILVTLEIGDEDFYSTVWENVSDSRDGRGKVCGPAIWQVVAGDGCNDNVLEFKASRGLGHAGRLFCIKGEHFARGDVAIGAVPSADAAHDKEGRHVLGEAFPFVGALGALADRVQVQVFDEAGSAGEIFTLGELDPKPWRNPQRLF